MGRDRICFLCFAAAATAAAAAVVVVHAYHFRPFGRGSTGQ